MNRTVPSDEPAGEAALCREVIEAARQWAAERLHSAGEQAGQLVEAARNEVARDVSGYFLEIEGKADRQRASILASIPMEIRRLRAARRESALEAIRDAAIERCRQRDAATRQADLLGTIPKVISAMEGTAFVLRMSAGDPPIAVDPLPRRIEEPLAPRPVRLSVVIDPDLPPGGLIIETENGGQRWDNTLAARCSRLWPELRQHAATAAGWLKPRQRT
ncbi:MAG: V-type ATP synthase subunit E [Verrucomicrobiales bacterium]|nr:V-type ATP synthase subunit E [Verrucomicrobiales bacterium]